MEFYESMERNEVLLYCTTWMNNKKHDARLKKIRYKRSQILECLYIEFPQKSNPYRQNC